MKTRIVKRSEIDETLRFDGSYHNADGNIYYRIVKKKSQGKLSDYCIRIFTSGRNRRIYTDSDHGFPFLSNADASSANPFMACKYSSRKFGFDKESVLLPGMILTGRVGAIGQTVFVPNHWVRLNTMGSDNIIRIQVKENEPNGFLYAFLASSIGKLILLKHSTGGVQPFITDSMVGEIPVPKIDSDLVKKIDGMIKESARLREEAAEELSKAVSYFDTLYPIKDHYTKMFKRSIREIRSNFASFNNNLEVKKFIDEFRSNSTSIDELTDLVFAPPLFKHIYLDKDNGHPFMTGSELTQFNLRYYRWLSPRGVKDIQDYKVKEGTLLLYKSGTTDGGILGNVFIADKKLDGCCLSDHVIRMVFKDKKIAYWAFAFLRSKGSVKMLQSLATGTMIPFITPERLKEVRIPIPDDNFEEVIDSVEKYINWNSKSKELELEAISLVESEIEKWTKE